LTYLKKIDAQDFRSTTSNKKSPSRLDLIKNGLRMFVHTKQKMNPNHEFGIFVLTDSAKSIYLELTNDVEVFIKKLMNLQCLGDYHTFNITSLFEQINDKFPDIIKSSETRSSTEYIYRAIFIYARSNTIPHITEGSKPFITQMLDSPIFFFDGLYLHSKPSKENKPQEVYDFITEFEGKNHSSYFYENSTSVRRLHLHIAHLLAHPFQRAEQTAVVTSLTKSE